MKHRGQLALVGVIALALTLIALAYRLPPTPRVAYERGHLQAAQLVHVARACMAIPGGCTTARLWTLVQLLRYYNGTSADAMRMYPVSSVNYTSEPRTNGWVNTTTFTLVLPDGSTTTVRVVAAMRAKPSGEFYQKVVEGRVYVLEKVHVMYWHYYSSMWFNVEVCPKLYDPQGVADVRRSPTNPCSWLISVPCVEVGGRLTCGWRLRDEFGAHVWVGG